MKALTCITLGLAALFLLVWIGVGLDYMHRRDEEDEEEESDPADWWKENDR